MSTVGGVVDQVMRKVFPLDDLPPFTTTTDGLVNAADTSFSLEMALLEAEDEDQIATGTVLETSNGEQLLVTAIGALVGSAQAVTVTRGFNGTTTLSGAVAAASIIRISPPFPRLDAYTAVCDEVVNLYPTLWRTRLTQVTTSSASPYYTSAPSDFVTPLNAKRLSGGYLTSVAVDVHDYYDPATNDIAITFPGVSGGTVVELAYRAKFPRPTAEADDMNSVCGVKPEWERIVVYGAVASLLAERELTGAALEYVSEQLSAEAYPSGSSMRNASGFLRLRQMWLDEARRGLLVREPVPVQSNNGNWHW